MSSPYARCLVARVWARKDGLWAANAMLQEITPKGPRTLHVFSPSAARDSGPGQAGALRALATELLALADQMD